MAITHAPRVDPLYKLMTVLTLLLGASPALAATTDLPEILNNLKNVIEPLTALVMMVSFVGGIGLIFKAIGLLKRFGQPLTSMQQQGELAGPLVYFCVGSVLMYLPTASNMVSTTIFGDAGAHIFGGGSIDFETAGSAADLLSYSNSSITDKWGEIANTIVLYIQFIGFVAFVRGWFIIAKAGARGEQPGVITKGIVFIVSGIIAINFVPMIEILKNTIWGT
ncbi:MAG: hypothetical protein COC15_01345 [Legionellales bacterium]|nr:MAG: hypothetical protein COC15_01345 [Legionellales bacterium]